ncbi:hypothetical protein M4D79_02170 [Mycolicibacterium novocastrense]|nr:hypothetical protein M4D79_02170 [Mycolicibacterium novocastrense]
MAAGDCAGLGEVSGGKVGTQPCSATAKEHRDMRTRTFGAKWFAVFGHPEKVAFLRHADQTGGH